MTAGLAGGAEVLRRVVRGTAGVAELVEADQVVRRPLPLSRRIAFVSVAGGSGTSATAAAVANLWAARRTGMVLGVDAAGGPAALGWHAGRPLGDPSPDGPAPDVAAARRRAALQSADARAGLGRADSGLHLLDLSTAEVPAAAVPRWRTDVSPIARFFDLVVTDWGVRRWEDDLAAVAQTGHVLALLARADRHSATQAAAVLPRLLALEAAPAVVLVLVDVRRTSDRVAASLRRQLAVPVAIVSHEPATGAANLAGGRRLGPRTRREHIGLAAQLITAASRPVAQTPNPVQPVRGRQRARRVAAT